MTLSPEPEPVSIVGPDNCPWHYRDPAERIELYDRDRYVGPATAETLCDSWHVNACIQASMAEVWDRAMSQLHEFLNERGPDPELPPSPVEALVFCPQRPQPWC